MNKNFNKRIIAFLLITTFIFPYFFFPREAYAIPVVDAPHTALSATNLVETVTSTASEVGTEVSTFSTNYKEMILDPIANGLAKMVVQQITNSIVNWINSGFEGSPSFVQNPGAFFLDIADQATGQFLTGGILNQLCSPFSIDLRIALSFKYHPRAQKRYACTLSTIIKNTVSAAKNASINGFTAGDFKQGGWPAFVSLTTEPQNNIYGAYLQAESDLSFNVASMKAEQRDELNQGKGFLSWKKCKNVPVEGGDPSTGEGTTKKVCETQTPGSVISGSLEKTLGSGTDQLNLADEFGEIVNALFAALITKVISSSGLAGTSQRDYSGTSYLDQINGATKKQEVDIVKAQINEIKKVIMPSIKNAKTLLQNRKKSYDLINNIIDTFASSTSCYYNKINSSSTPLTDYEKETAQGRIQAINELITSVYIVFEDDPDRSYYVYRNGSYFGTTTSLTRIYSKVENDYTEALALSDLFDLFQNTVDEPDITLQELNTLTTDPPKKITSVDLRDANQDYVALRNNKIITIDLFKKANDSINECRSFPTGIVASSTITTF